MAKSNSNIKTRRISLSPARALAMVAVLAPFAYLAGRYATSFPLEGPWYYLASGVVALALGALIGIPVGLFFGNLTTGPQATPADIPGYPDHRQQQDKILAQIRTELAENLSLFNARKGDTGFLTRIMYLTGFWNAVKASGQLFVLQDPKLLNTIAMAYYWADQANRLENLAYESKYAPTVMIGNQNATTHLIAEARLLDGPLGQALTTAIDAINTQISADTGSGTKPSPAAPVAPVPQPEPTFAEAAEQQAQQQR